MDTCTVCSSYVTPNTVRVNQANNCYKIELEGNILKAVIDTKGYDDNSDDSTIENIHIQTLMRE
jgi:hypothetical protein